MRRSEIPARESVARSLGPFVTRVTQRRAGLSPLLRTSRRHRKGLPPIALASEEIRPNVAIGEISHQWLRVWAPRRLGWWIAVLFMVGSALFALGGAQATWPAGWLHPSNAGWVFFAGSLFFTSAAYLQWLEALNNDVAEVARPEGSRSRRWRFFGWYPRNLGFLSASVQLVGTLLFNADTADALVTGLGWEGEDVLVWTPNVAGSICFLVASELALMEFSHDYWSFQPRVLSWWIVAVNLLGSLLFQIAGFASIVEPGSVMVAPWMANFCTFAGAICFLVGAYLLIPELFERTASPIDDDAAHGTRSS